MYTKVSLKHLLEFTRKTLAGALPIADFRGTKHESINMKEADYVDGKIVLGKYICGFRIILKAFRNEIDSEKILKAFVPLDL